MVIGASCNTGKQINVIIAEAKNTGIFTKMLSPLFTPSVKRVDTRFFHFLLE